MRCRRLVHPRSLVAALAAAAIVAGCAASTDVESLKADEVGSTGDDPGADDSDTADPDADEPDATSGDEDPGTLDWTACEASSPLTSGFECATLDVPLDHGEPDGEQIELALIRSPATGNARIGSLVFNPGGPGGSGIEFLTAAAGLLPYDIVGRFDLVSFDPRGVGSSTAIDCDVDLDDTKTLEEGDDAGWSALVAAAEAGLDECTAETADLAPHVGTNSAARDLDLIREALGDEQLSYVGFSYGTRLGAVYAELFPDRVRALVLDGAVKPTSDLAELDAGQGPAFDNAFERFAAECDADADDCPLGDVGATEDVYDGLREQLADGATLATDDPDRSLNLGELELAVAAALYSTETWPVLAQGLADAAGADDGSILQALVDGYVGRRPDGTYDDSQAAGGAINCADDPARPSAAEMRQISETVAAESIWFDEFLRADTGCIGLPEAIDPVGYGPAAGADPILVIGTTNDPATPYEWSVELAELLDSGVLFTVEGDGHTAFLSIDCVEDVVVDYLVDLRLPDGDSASCADDTETDGFPPAGESEFDQVLTLFDCLRDNGADIPDITLSDLIADPSGESLLEVLDPTDPAFVEAAMECQDVIGEL